MLINLLLNVINRISNEDYMQQCITPSDNMGPILKTIVSIAIFCVPVIIVFIIFNNKNKKEKLQFEERMKMIEKGMQPPPLPEKKLSILFNNSNKPIAMWVKLLLGVGVGLLLGMFFEKLGFDSDAAYFSMIFICVSIMIIFGDNLFGKKNIDSDKQKQIIEKKSTHNRTNRSSDTKKQNR